MHRLTVSLAVLGLDCRRALVVAAIGAVATTGCVDTSPDRVKLTATIQNVALSVTQGSLVTTLGGTFDVELDVGDLASADATIQDPPSFQLVQATGQQDLATLDAVASGGGFPLTVKSGEKQTVTFTLSDRNTLAAADVTSVCAGTVEIAGSLTDSLTADRPLAFESSPATLGGCP